MNTFKDQKMSEQSDSKDISTMLVVVGLIVGAWPYIPCVEWTISHFITPVYVSHWRLPVANDPAGRLIFIALAIWEAFGMVLLLRVARDGLSDIFLAKWLAILIVFFFPIEFVSWTAPAIEHVFKIST